MLHGITAEHRGHGHLFRRRGPDRPHLVLGEEQCVPSHLEQLCIGEARARELCRSLNSQGTSERCFSGCMLGRLIHQEAPIRHNRSLRGVLIDVAQYRVFGPKIISALKGLSGCVHRSCEQRQDLTAATYRG